MYGIKHIVECHCVLPQYRKRKNPLFHKFIVFSVVDEGDTVVAKHAQCNNCGVIHRVFDICKSEIVTGRDELGSLLSIDDIKFTIVPDVARVLESYSAELPTWEHAQFILQNEQWGEFIVLTRDQIDGEVQGKRLIFESSNKFRIEPYTFQPEIERQGIK